MKTRNTLLLALLTVVVACGAYQQNADRDEGPLVDSASESGQVHAKVAAESEEVGVLPEVLAQSALPAASSRELTVFSHKVVASNIADKDMRGISRRTPTYLDYGRENYQTFENNAVHWARQDPVSTFSIDVDTASYANVRRILNQGQLPNPDAVRVEELVNYFSYDYPQTNDPSVPFSVYTELGPSPWDAKRHLLHVGVNGWQPAQNSALPPVNLVFLIDVSGSMRAPDKIGLLKSAMKLLVKQLRPQDRLSIAVYAGSSGEVLAPTAGDQKATIYAALDRLQAGGSTNGGAGIRLAYNLARQNFIDSGVNRVILATDGDFNVGTTDIDELERLVEMERKSGVALTVLGFGTGNYNDHLMQKIAQIGNGNAAYIDSINEARKVLVDELGATLNTIAKDVKIQIEFNPQVVESYRLIGYETRHLNREDFNNDQVDAGEIGAGHTVTALYELTLVDGDAGLVDALRYGTQPAAEPSARQDNAEIAFLKLRYKEPDSETSRLIEHPLYRNSMVADLAATSESYRFSASVAWLGQLLRHNNLVADVSYQNVIELAQAARGTDRFGYRSEFINLVRTAEALSLISMSTDKPSEGSVQDS
jgi:Ca-activated chloride channel family protein